MKRKYLLTAITAILTVCLIRFGMHLFHKDYSQKNIKVGFVYIGDGGTPYTNNFVRSQNELEKAFPDNVFTLLNRLFDAVILFALFCFKFCCFI